VIANRGQAFARGHDHDRTLWAEQPTYAQLFFALDRLKLLGPQHPQWQSQDPFASSLKADHNTALAGGEPAIHKIIMASHAGMTKDEFASIVKTWINTAKHPTTNHPFSDMVYQTFKQVFGVPPEQVIGSASR
jgi:hypothetical protein